MSDLNERAAKAMGWELVDFPVWRSPDGELSLLTFDPEHDRNAAHELLMEVGRRGMDRRFGYALRFALDGENKPNGVPFDTEFINDSDDVGDYTYIVATAPLELIVTAACEVLEQK